MLTLAKHRIWKKNNILTRYVETEELGSQCVAGVKKYSSDVLGIDLGSFSWSAINGWNTWSPFKGKPFNKIENTPSFVPRYWDIAFFQIWEFGHTCVVDEFNTSRIMFVIEENWGNGNWQWKDDFYQVKAYDYLSPKFLGVARSY